MLNLEELETINNFNNKPNNKFRTQINKIEEKKPLVNSINPNTFYEYKFAKIQEKTKLSSKNLKLEKNFFFMQNESNKEYPQILNLNNSEDKNISMKLGFIEKENKILFDSTGINSTNEIQNNSLDTKEENKTFSDSNFPSANKIFFSENKKESENFLKINKEDENKIDKGN